MHYNADKIRLAGEFNDAIKLLLHPDIIKNDGTLLATRTKIMMLIKATPLNLIDESVPIVWSHRKIIKSIYNDGNYNWDVIDDIKSELSIDDQETSNVIDIIYKLFKQSNEAERIHVYKIVVAILNIIISYRKL